MTSARQEEWFRSAPGRAMNLDAVAGLQCVDVPNDYAEWIFGNWEKTIGRGDARQKYDIAPSAYWLKIPYKPGLVPDRGDVVVWPGSSIVKEGHTAVVTSASALYMSMIEQSGGTNRAAYLTTHPYRVNNVFPIGFLRPRQEKILGGSTMDYGKIVLDVYRAFGGRVLNLNNKDEKALFDQKVAYLQESGDLAQFIRDVIGTAQLAFLPERLVREIYKAMPYKAAEQVIKDKTSAIQGGLPISQLIQEATPPSDGSAAATQLLKAKQAFKALEDALS